MIKKYLVIFSIISLCVNSNILNANKEFNIDYKKHNDLLLRISINLGEIVLTSTSNDDVDYIRLHSEGAYHSKELGSPELLQFNQLIEIPYHSNIRVEIIKEDYRNNQKKEQEFLEEINEKYGDGELDPETGIFHPTKS